MSDDSSVEHDDEEISDDQTSGPDDASSASAQPQKMTGKVEMKNDASSAVKSIFSILILLGGLVVGGGRAFRRIAPDTYSTLTRLFDATPDVSRARPSIREQARKLRLENPEVESLDLKPKSYFEDGRALTEFGKNTADLYRQVDQIFQDQGEIRHDLIRSPVDQRNLGILCALLHGVSIEHVVFDAKELDRYLEFYAKAQEYLGPLPQYKQEQVLWPIFQALNNPSSTNTDTTGDPSISTRKVALLHYLRQQNNRHTRQ